MNQRKADKAPGQQKQHAVTHPDTGEVRIITQEQWRNRANDPTLAGFQREDETGDELEEPEAEPDAPEEEKP